MENTETLDAARVRGTSIVKLVVLGSVVGFSQPYLALQLYLVPKSYNGMEYTLKV